ncbi:MAG: DNA-binding response regulator [Dehalococcoidia bacterium]|nr:MAG: DNA-binding response regulator [Dehalococcoidia bacterium]
MNKESDNSKTIKVMLVDDQQLVREGLRRMLELDDEITVVGEATSGEDAIVKADELQPDIILMDVRMPGMGGIEATRQLKAKECKANIIILTVYEDKYLAQAAEAGAVGYLLKDIGREELSRSIKLANVGQSPFAPSVTRTLFQQFGNVAQLSRNTLLTPRQLDILRLVAAGVTNREIATKLCVSEATIKRETNTIFSKLDAVDRTQAVAEAYRRNML